MGKKFQKNKIERQKMNINKLTIELTGKPITPHLKIFADDVQIGRLQNLKISADVNDILVNIEMLQSKIVEKNGKKEVVTEPLILKWGK
jgi:hypothetical protein